MRSVSTGFKLIAAAALSTALSSSFSFADDHPVSETADWQKSGRAAIEERLAYKPISKKAKNVILFIGDGMGISTLTAGRIFEAQLRGESGEESYLSFERFPNTALVKTYNVDAQVADSAGTASALNTGVKTRIGVINTAPHVARGTCPTAPADKLKPLAAYAEAAGLKTGVVSTARLTHATPAAVYANSPNRDWENDTSLGDKAGQPGCEDIASQITGSLGGDGLDLALGGGRANFLPAAGSAHGTGRRADGRDIVSEWLARDNASYVADRASLMALKPGADDHILGLFSNSHMSFEQDRLASDDIAKDEPTLAEMTEFAINQLSKSDTGFYLMVEAGRIDHAHHDGNASRALNDTVALSAAVRKALSMVDLEETLILVTADHSHVFTMAGYPRRGNPILGLMEPAGGKVGEPLLALDGKPYTTLGYQNGKGAVSTTERPHLEQNHVLDGDFKQQALVPLASETHGGEDVGLFATGPWAHLARGTMEQNVVFHLMYHALELDTPRK